MRRYGIAAFCAILAASSVEAAFASFGLVPTMVTMDARDRSASIAITNNDLAPREFEAELFAWEQAGDREELTPAGDMLVAPAVFTLQPGETQTVRVGARKLEPRPIEGTYRIVITEVSSGLGRRSGVDTTTKVSVPIFVRPQAAERPHPLFSLTRIDAAHVELAVDNPGIEHVHLLEATLSGADKTVYYRGPLRGYVLAKQREVFALPLQRALQGDELRLHVSTDADDFERSIRVTGR